MSPFVPPGSLSTDEGRELVRQRAARYGLVAATFGGVFWLTRVASALIAHRPGEIASTSSIAHFIGVAMMTALWLSCRSGPRSQRFVANAELFFTAGACASYCALVIGLPAAYRPDVKLAQALLVQLLGRAVYVPSTWQRTAILGAIVTVPFLASIAWTFRDLDPAFVASMHAHQATPETDWEIRLNLVGEDLVWWIGTLGISTWVSAVIYGLRRQVSRAMRLGQYTLEAKLGEGGMGVVYRGRHAMLKRPTAIKLLQPERVGEAGLARFEREVRATAALSHPNTVTIFDYGRTPEGTFYYAMELLDGATLTRIVRVGGPMPAARVVHVLEQIAGALAEAHDTGLIHRDIKPDNILLTRHGGVPDFVKVVDFGLVKEVDLEGAPSLTREDAIVGTPLYMAPECIRGRALRDGRSDLYAVGAVGYFLLTGEHVFEGSTVIEICSQHLEREPRSPSDRLGAAVPADLERIVMACLRKDPADRPATAHALAMELAKCECRGKWAHGDAERWWREHGPDAVVDAVAISGEDTLAIDLARRT